MSSVSNNNSIDPATFIHEDVFRGILSSLDLRDLGRCCLVSKGWNQIANDDRVWKYWLQQYTSSKDLISLPDRGIKAFIAQRVVFSLEGLQKKFLSAVGKLDSGKELIFKCSFPFNEEGTYLFEADINEGRPIDDKQGIIREVVIFPKKLPVDMAPSVAFIETSNAKIIAKFSSNTTWEGMTKVFHNTDFQEKIKGLAEKTKNLSQ